MHISEETLLDCCDGIPMVVAFRWWQHSSFSFLTLEQDHQYQLLEWSRMLREQLCCFVHLSWFLLLGYLFLWVILPGLVDCCSLKTFFSVLLGRFLWGSSCFGCFPFLVDC